MKKFFAPALFLPFLAYTTFIKEEIFFTLLIVSIVLLGLFEFYNMVFKEDWWFLGLFAGIIIIGSASLNYKFPGFLSFFSEPLIGIIVSLCVIFILALVILRKEVVFLISKNSIIAIIFGIFYIAFFLSHLVLIRGLPHGSLLVLYLFSVVWSSDGGGWVIGKHFGRHRNIFSASSNKSIEGLIGAIIASLLTSVLIGKYMGFSLFTSLFLGLLFGFMALFGDLAESSFKRNVGKKDSDTWISEYGGILDVFDSIIVCSPIFYYIIILKGA